MNKVFPIMIILAAAVFIFTDPGSMLPAAIEATNDAVKLALALGAVYALWLGILRIAEAAGLNKILAKILKPFIRFLFGKVDEATSGYLALNLSANILGMGNAATPMGLKAMESLDDGNTQATAAMIMLLVLNSTSLQLIPTTAIGLRAAEGSMSASDIVLPVLIASVTTTAVAVTLCKILAALKKKRAARKQKHP